MTSGVARPHGAGLLRLPHYGIRQLFAGFAAKVVSMTHLGTAAETRPRPERRYYPEHREKFVEDAAMRREMFRL